MSQKDQIKDIVISEKPELTFKSRDEEVIRIISQENEEFLEGKYQEMLKFMRDNHSQDYTEEQKDQLYKDIQIMWNEVSGKEGGKLNSISFNLILHQEEYNYLKSVINNKTEYTVDTIFYAMEIQSMMEKMLENNKFESQNQAKPFEMTAVDIHYLYHIISSHKVKGINKQSIIFAEIIKRIALSSKVFNYYKEMFDNIAKAVQLWVTSLDKGFYIDKNDKSYNLIWGDSDKEPDFKPQDTPESQESSQKDDNSNLSKL